MATINNPSQSISRYSYISSHDRVGGLTLGDINHTILSITCTTVIARVNVRYERLAVDTFYVKDTEYIKFRHAKKALLCFLDELVTKNQGRVLSDLSRHPKSRQMLNQLLPSDHWFLDKSKLATILQGLTPN